MAPLTRTVYFTNEQGNQQYVITATNTEDFKQQLNSLLIANNLTIEQVSIM